MEKRETLIAVNRLLAITAQLQTTRFSKHLEGMGLTMAQFSVISHLANQSGPVSITRTAQAVEVLQPAVTKMVRKFENSGWLNVLPDPEDKRSRLIELTPQGHALIGQFYARVGPEAGACFGDWSKDDLEAFHHHLKRVVTWLDDNRLT